MNEGQSGMTIRRFEIMAAPLAGTMLIDASAGTGKTYTIAALLVRLLLERDLELKDVLVVTFTEAAAEDLRSRIRAGIKQAAAAFEKGQGDTPFLAALLAARTGHAKAAVRLNRVLRNFDEAAVFTIHGFCQRVLAEHSLETGVLFDSELIPDLRDLLRQIVEDFFRARFYQESPLVVQHCLSCFNPDALRRRLGNLYTREDLEVRPCLDGATVRRRLSEAETAYRAALARTAAAWPARRQAVTDFLLDSPQLNRNQYRKKSVEGWLAELETLLGLGEPGPALFKEFKKFTSGCLRCAMKKGFAPPAEPFFDLCEELQAAHSELEAGLACHVILLETEVLAYVRAELAHRKAQAGICSFDDLLTSLRQALRGPGGAALARGLRSRYAAALIDEFQDTDPVQYEIFTTIFRDPDSLLYLIGDPKQAIYSFRGADIFAYIRAVRDIAARYTLVENWRSVPELVTAVNTLFGRASRPFVFDEILFTPALAAEKPHAHLQMEGRGSEPFRLQWVRRPDAAGAARPVSKELADRLLLPLLTGEIGRLLEMGRSGRARLGERPLGAGDIAVLVRTNRQARMVQEALTGVGIASVLNGSESLFASREAAEVGILLRGVVECGSSRRLRAALATRLLAVEGAELDLFRDESLLDGWYERFRFYRDLWESAGFVRMFGDLLDREGVRARLLAQPGGERALTNVLHLQEILHGAASGLRLGLPGLLKYLQEKIAGADDNPGEELQLRLASDAELVQIITIHKAKGLQYPVVFCPFCWEGSQILGREKGPGRGPTVRYLFHDQRGAEYRMLLDLGSQEAQASRAQALREELAENLRLLYVALTRAINRCYLFWGPFASAGTSAAAYLLYGENCGAAGAEESWGADLLAGVDDEAMVARLAALCAESGGTMALDMGEPDLPVSSPPGVGGAPVTARRLFSGRCRDDWRVESFSSLHKPREIVTVPHSAGHFPERAGLAPAPDFFSHLANFPAGPGPGTFLHGLLEEMDFSGTADERARFLPEKLRGAGFDLRWAPVLATMLDELLQTPLSPAEPTLTLAAIGPGDRISELEFYFPLAAADPARLENILSVGSAGLPLRPFAGLSGRRPDGLRGMMKGYIDLVFRHAGRYYLLDWKSNHLGPDPEAYRMSRLQEVMVREGYCLQALIYTVALHLHLTRRVPGYSYDEHFGGVFYLFLRGVGRCRDRNSGIFRDRPERKLVEELAALLTGA